MNEFGKFVLRVHKLMDDSPAFTAGMVLVLVLCIVWSWWKGRKAKMAGAVSGVVGGFVNHSGERGLLSQAVYWWSRYDPLRVVDLLRSLIIIGASGSGKTSGSGFQLAKAMVGMGRKIALCILSSKPEDRGFWVKVFGRRRKDLLIFGPTSPLRFNLIDFLQQSGADTREITQAIMTVGEIVRQNGGGRDNEPFWRQQYERMIFCAVEVLRLALGRVTAPDVQKFISDAAQTPDMMREEIWQKGYHNRCLEAAYNNPKTALDRHNFELALDYYHNQFPTMSDRTRSSILAGVMGILHVFNTGIVRELLSTATNVSPAVFDKGISVLVDMPISTYGASGAFVLGAWKYATQWYILKRYATKKTPVCVIHCDEYQKVVNNADQSFLAECRSHRGCMVVLTQSIHSLYIRLHEGGEHEADSLLTGFGHKIFHTLADDKTAAYASSLVGRRLTTRMGGSMGAGENVGEELFGKGGRYSANFSESVESILENRVFMQGLRTGGRESGYVVDGIVIRSGEPFSTGENFLRVAFSQR